VQQEIRSHAYQSSLPSTEQNRNVHCLPRSLARAVEGYEGVPQTEDEVYAIFMEMNGGLDPDARFVPNIGFTDDAMLAFLENYNCQCVRFFASTDSVRTFQANLRLLRGRPLVVYIEPGHYSFLMIPIEGSQESVFSAEGPRFLRESGDGGGRRHRIL
jgi:hypothetical protein